MFRDCSAIYNKFRGLDVRFAGFIEFQNFSPMGKHVDQRHGRVHIGPAGSANTGCGGASPACGA
jgi:hypothetical protein